ncbi:MAG: lipid-A-disaccharide synthase N-terminal domain-containing protein [Fusobacteriaceae bacterium]
MNFFSSDFTENIFRVIGYMGNIIFGLRFLLQWIASEKRKKSHLPFAFWIFSIVGSVLSLTYAIYKKDPVFIIGQAPNVLIYSRNIFIMKKYS